MQSICCSDTLKKVVRKYFTILAQSLFQNVMKILAHLRNQTKYYIAPEDRMPQEVRQLCKVESQGKGKHHK